MVPTMTRAKVAPRAPLTARTRPAAPMNNAAEMKPPNQMSIPMTSRIRATIILWNLGL